MEVTLFLRRLRIQCTATGGLIITNEEENIRVSDGILNVKGNDCHLAVCHGQGCGLLSFGKTRQKTEKGKDRY